MRALLAIAALIAAPVSAEPVQDSVERAHVESVVSQMDCLHTDMVTGNIGVGSGTMWRYGQGQMITAFHVWNIGKCGGAHQSFKAVYTDYDLDIAILATTDANETAAQIDCTPIKKGDQLVGYGYAHSGLIKIEVTATGGKIRAKDTPRWPGGYVVKGVTKDVQFQHGTSGGPVFNKANGKVQGIIVGHDESEPFVTTGESYVRALADTPLCGKTADQVLTENGVKLIVVGKGSK
jgi:S1-C subfamily serine protease